MPVFAAIMVNTPSSNSNLHRRIYITAVEIWYKRESGGGGMGEDEQTSTMMGLM
jgi:hypothetical protein